MADKVQKLKFIFGANTKQFQKDIDGGKKAVQNFARQGSGAVDKFASAFGVNTNAIRGSLQSVTGSFGAFGAGMKSAAASSGILSKALKILKMALLSTGIGAILVALGSLIAYFKSSEEGQSALNKVVKVFGVILGNLSDIAAKVGEFIWKSVTKPKEAFEDFQGLLKKIGDFFQATFGNVLTGSMEVFTGFVQKAFAKIGLGWQKLKGVFVDNADGIAEAQAKIEDFNLKIEEGQEKVALGAETLGTAVKNGYNKAKTAVQGFVAETQKEIAQAKELADLQLATDKMERDLNIEKAKRESVIADLRLKARQEDQYTARERLGFLNEALVQEDEIAAKEEIIAKNRLKLREMENSFSKSTKENLDEEARLKAEVYRVEAARLNAQRQIERERIRIRREILANTKEEIELLSTPVSDQAALDPMKLVPMELINTRVTTVKQDLESIGEVVVDMNSQINSAFQTMAEGVGEWIGAMSVGAGTLDGFKILIAGTFADLAINIGKTAIQSGLAVKGITEALKTMNWAVAVAAGVALVALGTAIKSKMSSMASGGSGSSVSIGSAGSRAGSLSFDTRSGVADAKPLVIDLTVSGEMKAEGGALVTVIEKETSRRTIST